jgi:hypothetical protein
MPKPSFPSTVYLVALVGWETRRGRNLTVPFFYPGKKSSRALRKERENKMISAGFFSGLVAQSEIDDLLDMLYGSYGERLIVSYKKAS